MGSKGWLALCCRGVSLTRTGRRGTLGLRKGLLVRVVDCIGLETVLRREVKTGHMIAPAAPQMHIGKYQTRLPTRFPLNPNL